MEQQKHWECFWIKTGRWVEFKLGYWLLSKIDATGSVDRCSGSGRPRTARSPDTISDVQDLVLSGSEPRRDYAEWGILQERVYKHQWITDVEELPACWGGMGPSGAGSDWQCHQRMAQATDSLRCSRRRTFWTFTLYITAFVHILINMF